MSLSVTVFIDLAEFLAGLGVGTHGSARIDWDRVSGWLATDAAAAALSLPVRELRCSEIRVYVPAAAEAASPVMEAIGGLTRAPDTIIVRVKGRPGVGECLACDLARTPRCHHCRNLGAGAGMLHSAVSAAMAADVFRLLREGSLDVAVLLSSDRALVPVIRFMEGRGTRVAVGGFSPGARELARAASGVVDLSTLGS
jgi:uncharacterized LabA/DUF88 family protein